MKDLFFPADLTYYFFSNFIIINLREKKENPNKKSERKLNHNLPSIPFYSFSVIDRFVCLDEKRKEPLTNGKK
jgi:hypothetical protein